MPHFQKRQRVFLLVNAVIGPCRITRVNDDNTFNLSYHRKDGKRVVRYAISAPNIFANLADALSTSAVGSVSEIGGLLIRKTPEYLYEVQAIGRAPVLALCGHAADLIDRALIEGEKARRSRGNRTASTRKPSYLFSVKWIAYNDDSVNMDQDNIEGYISVALVADQFSVCREKVAADVLRLRVEWEKSESVQDFKALLAEPVED